MNKILKSEREREKAEIKKDKKQRKEKLKSQHRNSRHSKSRKQEEQKLEQGQENVSDYYEEVQISESEMVDFGMLSDTFQEQKAPKEEQKSSPIKKVAFKNVPDTPEGRKKKI
jgi:hypothetical protein